MRSMPRFKEEDRDRALSETRRSLLAAAAEEFAREGYHGANINQISLLAGFAKGTVYNYFDSKRALMQELIQDTAELHLNFIRQRVEQEEDAARRLEAFFEAGFDFVIEWQARGRAIVNNLFGPDAGFKEELYRAYLPMFELVGGEILARGLAQGIFRSLDPAGTANLLMLIYLGAASQSSPEGLPWIEASQVADQVLNGLRDRSSSRIEEG
jgi:AcrR family transcriptional regulator